MDNDTKVQLEKFAQFIHGKGMSVPSIFILESTKYLSFLGNQFLYACGPLFTSFVNETKYYNIANIMEDKQNIEFLIEKIEDLNSKDLKWFFSYPYYHF